jgi:O-methyltransferase
MSFRSRAREAGRRRLLELVGRTGYRLGFKMVPLMPPECDAETADIVRRVAPYTLTSTERVMVLCDALAYLTRARIPGAIVECGVGRGGSMMAAALALARLGDTDREFYLYDTFTHQPPPGARDELPPALAGLSGSFQRHEIDDPVLAERRIDDVRDLIASTGYPTERVNFIPGLVEETIPGRAPGQIALCRLDTDWYGSVAHEMRHLYPRISPGGVLVIDDYGDLPGARRAVDEYLDREAPEPVMLTRIDESARVAVRPRA